MLETRSRAFLGRNNAAYKTIKQSDYITRHRIFNRLLEMLSNPQIRNRQTGMILNYILHEKTKNALLTDYGFTKADIEEIEADLLEFAEHIAPNYEVIRNVPSALFYDLKQSDETDLILKKRAVAVPNFIVNACVCDALEREFARSDILACCSFILVEGYLRLDLDEKHARRGFITPQIDSRSGFIRGLRVFRYPRDERPFILQSRTNSNLSEVLN